MEIFLDESGAFEHGSPRFCCMGALAIVSQSKNDLFAEFEKLKNNWGITGERKGSDLNEDEIASVLSLLSKYQALFDVNSMLMADKQISAIRKHQREAAWGMLVLLTADHLDEVQSRHHKYAADTLTLSSSLFMQFILGINLIPRILQHVLSGLWPFSSCITRYFLNGVEDCNRN